MMALGVEGLDVMLFYLEVACGEIFGKELADSIFAVRDGWNFNQLAMQIIQVECGSVVIQ